MTRLSCSARPHVENLRRIGTAENLGPGDLHRLVHFGDDVDTAVGRRFDLAPELGHRSGEDVEEGDLATAREHGPESLDHLVAGSELVNAVVAGIGSKQRQRSFGPLTAGLEGAPESAKELVGRHRSDHPPLAIIDHDRALALERGDGLVGVRGRLAESLRHPVSGGRRFLGEEGQDLRFQSRKPKIDKRLYRIRAGHETLQVGY